MTQHGMTQHGMDQHEPRTDASIRPQEMLSLLEQSGAILHGHFLLTSGRHSDLYLEKFRLLERPHLAQRFTQAMAEALRPYEPRAVVGPMTGGILLAYDVARWLGPEVRSLFTEREAGRMAFRRGFRLAPGERVAVVEDIITSGGSVAEVIQAVREAGAEPVAVSCLVDRSGGQVDLGIPLHALLTMKVESYAPADCPLCRQGIPLEKRGSRDLKREPGADLSPRVQSEPGSDALPRQQSGPQPTMAVQPSNVSSSAASAARPRVVVVMGSDSDLEVMRPAAQILAELGIPVQLRVLSAHRTPEDAAAFARQAAGEGVQALIAGAGGAAHLAGFLAAHTWLPVIGVPVQSGPLAGLDALYSTVQMPPGVPVATVGINNARNAGLLAAQILAVSDGKVRAALEAFRQRQAAGVRAKDERVRQEAFPTQ